MHRSKHIGIVGCSAEGPALFYKTICIKGSTLLGAYAHPEVSLHTPSFADYVECLRQEDEHVIDHLVPERPQLFPIFRTCNRCLQRDPGIAGLNELRRGLNK